MAKEDLTQMLRDGEWTPEEFCPILWHLSEDGTLRCNRAGYLNALLQHGVNLMERDCAATARARAATQYGTKRVAKNV